MLPRRATAALLAVPLLLATGCGDVKRLQPDQRHATAAALAKPRATINPGPTSPPPTTAAPAPTSAAPTASGPGGSTGAPGGGGTDVKATIDNKFDPASIEVKVGDEVTWTADGVHTVNGGTGGQQDPASPIKGSEIGFKTYKIKFDKAGTYPYYCLPHFSLGMTGEVVVE
jgi:plastocyanin